MESTENVPTIRLMYAGKRLSTKDKLLDCWFIVDDDCNILDKNLKAYHPKGMPFRKPGMSYKFKRGESDTGIYASSYYDVRMGGTDEQIAEWKTLTKEAEATIESKKVASKLPKGTGFAKLCEPLHRVYRKLPFSARHHFIVLVIKAIEQGE